MPQRRTDAQVLSTQKRRASDAQLARGDLKNKQIDISEQEADSNLGGTVRDRIALMVSKGDITSDDAIAVLSGAKSLTEITGKQ